MPSPLIIMTLQLPISQEHATETLLTKIQVARRFGIHPRTVDNLMASGSIGFVRIGRAVRFEPGALETFKAACRINPV